MRMLEKKDYKRLKFKQIRLRNYISEMAQWPMALVTKHDSLELEPLNPHGRS